MRRKLRPQLLVALAVIFVVVASIYDLSSSQLKQYRLQEAAKKLIHHLQLKPENSFHQNVDQVRLFINRNSVHRIDERFYRYWKTPEKMIDLMTEHAIQNGPAPHMECSSRAGAMRVILRSLGFQTRAVALYQQDNNKWKSHSFLEVLNPETETWEIQDPDYNIYWINIAAGNRVGTIDLLKEARTKFVPCLAPGNCGWGKKNDEKMKIEVLYDYFQIASIINRKLSMRNLYANTQRLSSFSGSRRVSVQDYCEYIPKNCEQSIYLYDNE